MDDDPPEFRLARLRDREHILAGVIRAQDSWLDVLEVIAGCQDADEARERLSVDLGFSADQAVAVVDVQFRRVTRQDRQRIADELDDVRARIRDLEGE